MENIMMDQELQEELQDTPTGFCVDNDVKADWTLRKIAEIQAERDRMVDFHERQIEVTKAQAEIRINYLMEHLRRYTAQVPMKETKTQSKYSLPSGDLVMKKPAVAFRRDDTRRVLSTTSTRSGFRRRTVRLLQKSFLPECALSCGKA
ncbi:MAG: host-nuclease inhibitor Gam family protein, partial [Oscillospiraceae bacterium]|nr:host-nuclease inhibitor Gam family protein [Oscillospiraceae bacterium]